MVAFSGASPDAGLYDLGDLPDAAVRDEAAEIDAAALVSSSGRVAELVAAVLAGDPAAVRGALPPAAGASGSSAGAPQGGAPLAGAAQGGAPRAGAAQGGAPRVTTAAAISATAALAARLPALSGVTGPAAFDDEDPRELLLAYASLLTTRCESHRLRLAPEVAREQLAQVAQTAAAAAYRLLDEPGESGDYRPLGEVDGPDESPTQAPHPPSSDLVAACSTELPARTQLVAACLLLAQTSRDGGGSAAALRREVDDLFA